MSAQLPQCGEVSFALNCLLILPSICYAALSDLERPERMRFNSSELLFAWIACIGPLLCMSAISDLKKDASDDQRVERPLVKWFTTDDTPVIKEYFFLYLCQLCTRNGKLKNDSSNRIGARFKTMYDVVSATPIDPFYLADLLRRMEKYARRPSDRSKPTVKQQFNSDTFVYALIYMNRWEQTTKHKITWQKLHGLMSASLVVSHKMVEDYYRHKMSTFARIFGLDNTSMHFIFYSVLYSPLLISAIGTIGRAISRRY